MESATLLTPLAPAYAVFCFPSASNIPRGHAYEKENQQYIEAGEMFNHLMRHTDSCCGIYINNLQKRTLQKCLKIRLELNQLRAN